MQSSTISPVDKVVRFLASTPKAERIIAYRPSASEQARFDELLVKKKSSGLTEAEKEEVENFLLAEHMMRLAKLTALKKDQKAA
ncbi:MAG: hypothetical protein AAFU03_14595 [Bacteroidota bacterium]